MNITGHLIGLPEDTKGRKNRKSIAQQHTQALYSSTRYTSITHNYSIKFGYIDTLRCLIACWGLFLTPAYNESKK
jgi:hypothetical protein